jgi:putative thioredoxin
MSASSPWVFHVTEAEFEEKVVKKSLDATVVVDFWAPWCGPCVALAPLLEREIGQRNGEVLLAKVNTDEEQRLAMYYRIEGLPTVIAFKGGRPIDEFVGMLSPEGVADFIKRVGPSDLEKQAHAAEALANSDPAAAEKSFRETLAKDPNQEVATLGLVRLLIDRNRDKEAAELLENLGPGNQHADEIERLNALLWLRGKTASLPDEQTLRTQVDANPKNAAAKVDLGLRLAQLGRHQEALATLLAAGEADFNLAGASVKEAMVNTFRLIGNRSPLADEYRAKLTSLLY